MEVRVMIYYQLILSKAKVVRVRKKRVCDQR